MSGRKTYNLSGTSESDLLAGIGTVVSMTGRALQAYQERKRREKEAAIQKEQAIQQKIAEIRAGIRSQSAAGKVVVQTPTNIQNPTKNHQLLLQDQQKRVQNLQSQLPQIRAEYQTLIAQELLDDASVQKALQQTEIALQANNLEIAQQYLQALDQARIQVTQKFKAECTAQSEYLQVRLTNIQAFIPKQITQNIQINIDDIPRNWEQISDADIEMLHQEISKLELQIEQIHTAAENLVASWQQSEYTAQIVAIDDGDVVIEIETHEGANTQMRVQFDGQQIDLAGPHDQEGDLSCASRTQNALQLFQEQGYQLEWITWDGQPVDEEWRNISYENVIEVLNVPQRTEYLPESESRRLESEGY
ncbi:MAG TPA: hypothetical protein VK184_21790 [Nostocaceae cyanobacterium]|nr:hypothetical protein [Nostocaceae cyanobacterium]